MIDLIGGLRDYSVTLRRLFSARGNVRPVGAETVTPVIEVGPNLLHPWATPRLTAFFSDTVAPTSTLTRWLVNPPESGSIYQLKSFRARWVQGSTVVTTELFRVRISSFVQGGAVSCTTNTAVPQLDSLTGGTTGTVVTALDSQVLVSNILEPQYAQDREDFIWPGMAYQINLVNGDAVNRFGSWFMALQKFQLPAS